MTRETFTLTGIEHRGSRDGNERLVCHIQGGGLLAVWGDGTSKVNIGKVIAAGFPCSVECDPIAPGDYERDHFGHTHWVPQGNYLEARGV